MGGRKTAQTNESLSKPVKGRPPIMFCPFKGCTCELRILAIRLYGVVCESCGIVGPTSDSPKKAIDLWNQRYLVN